MLCSSVLSWKQCQCRKSCSRSFPVQCWRMGFQQAVPLPDYFQSEKNSLRYYKFPVWYVTLSSYLVATPLREFGTTLLLPDNSLPKLCLFQSKQDLLHELLLTGQVLQPPTVLITSAEVSPTFQCLFGIGTV